MCKIPSYSLHNVPFPMTDLDGRHYRPNFFNLIGSFWVFLVVRGVCPGGGGGVSSHGVSVWGCLPGGVPVDRMKDACENITLPQLRCGR